MGRIADMRNLGPVMERRLNEVGITSEEELRALGAVAAFARLRFADPRTSLNALHAMEAAIIGIPWQDLPKATKVRLWAELHGTGQGGGPADRTCGGAAGGDHGTWPESPAPQPPRSPSAADRTSRAKRR
ncbi:TfoX/Sxy family protein [Alsobacter sp. R-9]